MHSFCPLNLKATHILQFGVVSVTYTHTYAQTLWIKKDPTAICEWGQFACAMHAVGQVNQLLSLSVPFMTAQWPGKEQK